MAAMLLHTKLLRHVCTLNIARKVSLRTIYFGPIKISESLSRKLTEKNIIHPTEIQEKAMLSIVDGKDVILNSETGSGKTLCYLLPILEQLKQSQKTFQNKILSPSCALILAPTLELAEQIGAVCRELGETEINIACGNSPLRIKDSTKVVISIPSFIMNYDWQSLKNIKCIVFDEADSMLVERFPEIKKLLEFYTGRKTCFTRKERIRQRIKESKKKYVFSRAPEKPQLVFVGATIPSGGLKTARSLIEKFVPAASLIQSSNTHKVIIKSKFEFLEIIDDFDAKVLALAAILQNEQRGKTCQISPNEDLHVDINNSSNFQDENERFRAIVYTNRVSDAKKLFKELTRDSKKSSSKYVHKEATYRNETILEDEARIEEEAAIDEQQVYDDNLKINDNSNFTQSSPNSNIDIKDFRLDWKTKFCILHNELSPSQRLDVIEGLSGDKYSVLITTNLASRGLDIPNVNLIVQFDFASNIVAILHRAGRTARAGAEGKVVSFVSEKNKDLRQLFCSTIEKDESVTKLFSRKRRLRRRIKEGKVKSDKLSNS